MIMKKNFLPIIALALSATACVSDADLDVADNKGYINVSVSADNSMETRASATVSNTESWIKKVDDVVWNPSTGYNAGEHTVSVRNYESVTAALNVNDGWGDMYFEGSKKVNVTKGETVAAEVDCGTAKNARLSVIFNLPSVFTAYSVKATTTDTERNTKEFTFDSSTGGKKAYFKASEVLQYELTYTYDNNPSETISDKRITLGGAATDNIINISANDNGKITITIKADETFSEGQSETITIDAATGNEVTNS